MHASVINECNLQWSWEKQYTLHFYKVLNNLEHNRVYFIITLHQDTISIRKYQNIDILRVFASLEVQLQRSTCKSTSDFLSAIFIWNKVLH